MGVPHTRTIGLEHGLRAIGVIRVLQLLSNQIDGLFPADFFELAIGTLGSFNALEWLLDSIGIVDALTHVPPAHARANGAVHQRIVTGIIGQHSRNNTVLDL